MEELTCKILQLGEYSILIDKKIYNPETGIIEIATNERQGLIIKEIISSEKSSILYFNEKVLSKFTPGGYYHIRIWNSVNDYFYLRVFRGIGWNIKR